MYVYIYIYIYINLSIYLNTYTIYDSLFTASEASVFQMGLKMCWVFYCAPFTTSLRTKPHQHANDMTLIGRAFAASTKAGSTGTHSRQSLQTKFPPAREGISPCSRQTKSYWPTSRTHGQSLLLGTVCGPNPTSAHRTRRCSLYHSKLHGPISRQHAKDITLLSPDQTPLSHGPHSLYQGKLHRHPILGTVSGPNPTGTGTIRPRHCRPFPSQRRLHATLRSRIASARYATDPRSLVVRQLKQNPTPEGFLGVKRGTTPKNVAFQKMPRRRPICKISMVR